MMMKNSIDEKPTTSSNLKKKKKKYAKGEQVKVGKSKKSPEKKALDNSDDEYEDCESGEAKSDEWKNGPRVFMPTKADQSAAAAASANVTSTSSAAENATTSSWPSLDNNNQNQSSTMAPPELAQPRPKPFTSVAATKKAPPVPVKQQQAPPQASASANEATSSSAIGSKSSGQQVDAGSEPAAVAEWSSSVDAGTATLSPPPMAPTTTTAVTDHSPVKPPAAAPAPVSAPETFGSSGHSLSVNQEEYTADQLKSVIGLKQSAPPVQQQQQPVVNVPSSGVDYYQQQISQMQQQQQQSMDGDGASEFDKKVEFATRELPPDLSSATNYQFGFQFGTVAPTAAAIEQSKDGDGASEFDKKVEFATRELPPDMTSATNYQFGFQFGTVAPTSPKENAMHSTAASLSDAWNKQHNISSVEQQHQQAQAAALYHHQMPVAAPPTAAVPPHQFSYNMPYMYSPMAAAPQMAGNTELDRLFIQSYAAPYGNLDMQLGTMSLGQQQSWNAAMQHGGMQQQQAGQQQHVPAGQSDTAAMFGGSGVPPPPGFGYPTGPAQQYVPQANLHSLFQMPDMGGMQYHHPYQQQPQFMMPTAAGRMPQSQRPAQIHRYTREQMMSVRRSRTPDQWLLYLWDKYGRLGRLHKPPFELDPDLRGASPPEQTRIRQRRLEEWKRHQKGAAEEAGPGGFRCGV